MKDAENGDADGCEGGGMGKDRYIYKVDEDPEVRTGTISTSCAPGDYTVEVSISSPGNVELASATADFTITGPAQQQQEPPSTDATLSDLTLSDVTLAFASTTTEYAASVANDVDETTVTPTTNDDGATYAIKLGGVADADGVIPLAVGGNVITIEVTAGDGNTATTYTVTVTRAEPPAPGPAVAVELSPSGPVEEGTEITLTMSFANLESDSDTADTDYIFRANVVDADGCEGGGMGKAATCTRWTRTLRSAPGPSPRPAPRRLHRRGQRIVSLATSNWRRPSPTSRSTPRRNNRSKRSRPPPTPR